MDFLENSLIIYQGQTVNEIYQMPKLSSSTNYAQTRKVFLNLFYFGVSFGECVQQNAAYSWFCFSQQCFVDLMWCQGLNRGQPHARQIVLSPVLYLYPQTRNFWLLWLTLNMGLSLSRDGESSLGLFWSALGHNSV